MSAAPAPPAAGELVFLMGKYPAELPGGLLYSTNHLWLRPAEGPARDGGAACRVGLTAYSVRLLRDVHFLQWTAPAGAAVRFKEKLGEIESSKALSGLFAPATGALGGYNRAVLDDPSLINSDGYGDGWLFELSVSDADAGGLLDAAGYHAHLAATWEQTQRMIKKQMTTAPEPY